MYVWLALQQSPVHCCSCCMKLAAQLGLEGSPVLHSTNVPSSAPINSLCQKSMVLRFYSIGQESTGALHSAPTQPVLEDVGPLTCQFFLRTMTSTQTGHWEWKLLYLPYPQTVCGSAGGNSASMEKKMPASPCSLSCYTSLPEAMLCSRF